MEDPLGVHDLDATMLRLLGVDRPSLAGRSGGRDYRLTDLEEEVVTPMLA